MENEIETELHRCYCGAPAAPDDVFCARCRYFNNVFHQTPIQSESKRDKVLRAIEDRKMTRGVNRILVIE